MSWLLIAAFLPRPVLQWQVFEEACDGHHVDDYHFVFRLFFFCFLFFLKLLDRRRSYIERPMRLIEKNIRH